MDVTAGISGCCGYEEQGGGEEEEQNEYEAQIVQTARGFVVVQFQPFLVFIGLWIMEFRLPHFPDQNLPGRLQDGEVFGSGHSVYFESISYLFYGQTIVMFGKKP